MKIKMLINIFLLLGCIYAREQPSSVTDAKTEFQNRKDKIILNWYSSYLEDRGLSKRQLIKLINEDGGIPSIQLERYPLTSLRNLYWGWWKVAPKRKIWGIISVFEIFKDIKESKKRGIRSIIARNSWFFEGAGSLRKPNSSDVEISNKIFKSIEPDGDVGTDDDYDMILKELIGVMYCLKEDSDILTNDMVYNILTHGRDHVFLAGSENINEFLKFSKFGFSIPETENHLLMILGYKYLLNQWFKWQANLPAEHPRYDQRVKNLYNSEDREIENDGSALERKIFHMLGRIVYSDYFETNARAYNSFSVHMVNALYSFSDNEKIKMAAKNAMDFTALKYAFQSFEGKRYGPQRRKWEYKYRPGMLDNDYVSAMFGLLSGVYSNADFPNCNEILGEFRVDYCGLSSFAAYALWAGLFKYRLPDAILDFFVNKDNQKKGYGYYARMHPRYSNRHYLLSKAPRYFTDYDEIWGKDVEIEFAGEFYFGTKHYLNSAGGTVNVYNSKLNDIKTSKHVYSLFSRPSTLITKGDIGHWGEDRDGIELAKNEVMLMIGGHNTKGWKDWAWSRNSGVYKNFTYGYTSKDKGVWPMSVPPSWQLHGSPLKIGTATFKFYDRSDEDGVYIVTAMLTKSSMNWTRGFWEVVPKDRFSDIASLKIFIKNNVYNTFTNPEDENFIYQLATSREILELEPFYGPRFDNLQPILSINGSQSKAFSLYGIVDESTDHLEFPLIDVKQVNHNFNFTGITYAYSSGNGLITINNPKYGTYTIDSRINYDPRNNLPVPYYPNPFNIVPTIVVPLLLN